MTDKLRIFATIREAFMLLVKRLPKYAIAWVMPIAVYIILGFVTWRLDGMETAPLATGVLTGILSFVAMIWAFVSITQVTLYDKVPAKGMPYWSMRETMLVLRSIGWYLLMALTAAVFLVFFALLNFILPITSSLALMILCGLIIFIAAYYVSLRLVLILPASASNDATSFSAIWQLAKGHLWRLLGLFVSVKLILWVIISPLVFLVGQEMAALQAKLPADVSFDDPQGQMLLETSTFFQFFPFVGGVMMIPVMTYMIIILALAYKALRKE